MKPGTSILRRALLPVVVFLAVGVAHYVWLGVFPERDPAQDRWAATPAASEGSWLHRYLEAQSYWLGFSYALSLAFAAYALRRYREKRHCAARNLAVGGVTFSGFLAVLGCYLLGCCGSPMLAVYLNLFGAAFLPLAKPLVAVLTVTLTAAAWWWMWRRAKTLSVAQSDPACEDPTCRC